jgi:hypothetical protein
MKSERLAVALTLINLVLLTYLLIGVRSIRAAGTAPVLRGRALEIVDEQGRPRATITVLPVDPAVTKPTGKPHAETVLLRLIDPNGRPGVKIGASEETAGLSFVGESDRTAVVLTADGGRSSLKLTDGDGREHIVTP